MSQQPTQDIRLLHINPGNLYGGVETVLTTFARCRHLCPNLTQEFAVLYDGRLKEELLASGARVHDLGIARTSRPWTIWRARRTLTNLLKLVPFDAIACHQTWVQAIFGTVVARSPSKYLAYFHGPVTSTWIDRLASHVDPDQLIAPSQFTLATAGSLFGKLPGAVIYNPMPPNLMGSAALTRDERTCLRNQLGTKEDDVVIFQACRMERWKGPDVVLQALARLREIPGWIFWLAGGPQRTIEQPYFQQLREVASKLGIAERVRFLGQRSDVVRLMKAADIYSQGNRGPEGFSVSFIEACSAGLPIVTTRLGGAIEIVDAETGFLVEPENTASFAEALSTLLQNAAMRRDMGEAARRKVFTMCEPEQQLHHLRGVIERLNVSDANLRRVKAV